MRGAVPSTGSGADAPVVSTGSNPYSARRSGIHDRGALALSIVVGALIFLWAGSNAYRYSLVQTAAAYALIGVGVYVPFVLGGSLSLAYAAYATIGGYSVALIATETGLPMLLGWVIGPILAGFAAVVLGQLTRRLSGLHLAAITFLFAEAFQSWLNTAPGITGGQRGIGITRSVSFFGWEPGARAEIAMAIMLVIVVGFAVDRMRLSPWGSALQAQREVPSAVDATGIRVPLMKLVALGIGGAIAAFGGAVFTTATSVITPDTYTLNVIFLTIFMSLLGGQGTPWGPILGAALVVELTFNVPWLEAAGTLVVAAVVLFVMLIAPTGVLGFLDRARLAVQHRIQPNGKASSLADDSSAVERAGVI